jgi:hypothetical protein
MPRIEIERIDQAEDRDESSTESFDRIAFAERAVALVRPPKMAVAICEGTRHVDVEVGRQWGKAPGSRWAILSIPHNASRQAIANAVLGLYEAAADGQPGARSWALDVLMRALGRPNVPARMFGAVSGAA